MTGARRSSRQAFDLVLRPGRVPEPNPRARSQTTTAVRTVYPVLAVAALPPQGAIAFSTSTTVGASPADLLALTNDLPRLKQMDRRLRRVRWSDEGLSLGTAEIELDVTFSNALITRAIGESDSLLRG